MNILVTGNVGFIGYSLCSYIFKDNLLNNNTKIIGIDNRNNYYSPKLKNARNEDLKSLNSDYYSYISDLRDINNIDRIIQENNIDLIIHLAAQAGVRYCIEKPDVYIKDNVIVFYNILEMCRKYNLPLIYASSSSVYGGAESGEMLSENMNCNKPVSLYGATKISNEMMAQAYYNMFGIKSIGLRFFTVYGPWGRPDMAIWKWTKSILNDEKVLLFNYGKMSRSFTYIYDIIQGICGCINYIFSGEFKNIEIFNLGNDKDVNIEYVVDFIANYFNKYPKKEYQGMQLGDVKETRADVTKSNKILNYNSTIDIDLGLKLFLNWFLEYYEKKVEWI